MVVTGVSPISLVLMAVNSILFHALVFISQMNHSLVLFYCKFALVPFSLLLSPSPLKWDLLIRMLLTKGGFTRLLDEKTRNLKMT
nr:hypothetical transcript [Hymenolepis microstoma]